MAKDKGKTATEFARERQLDPQVVSKALARANMKYDKDKGLTKEQEEYLEEKYPKGDAPDEEKKTKPYEAVIDAVYETLRDTVDMLQEQLEEKDKQIEKLHELIDHEQKLNLAHSQRILELEAKEQKKPSLFKRIFGKHEASTMSEDVDEPKPQDN